MRRLEDFPARLPYKRYRHPVWDLFPQFQNTWGGVGGGGRVCDRPVPWSGHM